MSNRHASPEIRANVRKPCHEPFCREPRCAIVIVILCCASWSSGCRRMPSILPLAKSCERSQRLRLFSGALDVVMEMENASGYGRSGNPIRKQGQHQLEVGRVGESVISTGKDLQVFRACQ